MPRPERGNSHRVSLAFPKRVVVLITDFDGVDMGKQEPATYIEAKDQDAMIARSQGMAGGYTGGLSHA